MTRADPIGTSRRSPPPQWREERGAGTILALIIMMVLVVAAFVGGCGASWMRCAHTARSAADLSALAGAEALAAGGDACAVAARTVAQNDATLLSCDAQTSGDQVLVRVRVGVPAVPQLPGGPAQFTEMATAGRV